MPVANNTRAAQEGQSRQGRDVVVSQEGNYSSFDCSKAISESARSSGLSQAALAQRSAPSRENQERSFFLYITKKKEAC